MESHRDLIAQTFPQTRLPGQSVDQIEPLPDIDFPSVARLTHGWDGVKLRSALARLPRPAQVAMDLTGDRANAVTLHGQSRTNETSLTSCSTSTIKQGALIFPHV